MKIKDMIIIGILAIVLFILIVILFAVKDNLNGTKKINNSESKNTITIKYDSNGGNYITNSEITKGNTLYLPTPVREGYRFIGWYVDGNLVDENTKFDSNTILIAKWILIGSPYEEKEVKTSSTESSSKTEKTKKTSLKVTFDSKGGSYIEPITTVCNNVALDLPEDPVKNGYKFVKWVDKNGKEVSNGTIIACEDITLYATWEKEAPKSTTAPIPVGPTYVIHFESNGGTPINDISGQCNGIPVYFPTTSKEGYILAGWFDKDGNEVASGGIICGETTLYAKWVQFIPTPQPCAGNC